MTSLPADLVVLVTGVLVAVAAWLVAHRTTPRSAGLTGGAGLLVLGGLALTGPLARTWGLDRVSLTQISLAGLTLLVAFAVLPRRHLSAATTAAVLALILSQVVLATVPSGLPTAAAWIAYCALTWAALPAGPPRRIAAPYLVVAAVSGLLGSVVGGSVGSALLILAVAVRLGLFPFHSWVVAVYSLAPTTIAVVLTAPMAGVALVARTPMGFDDAWSLAPIVGLAIAAILPAGLALVQRELARAVGLLTVSVEATALLGVLDADNIGHLGGLVLWGFTSLALLGIGLVTAAVRSRLGVIGVDRYAGLLHRMPTFGALFLLFGLTAVGAPGTAPFASEDLVLHGAMSDHVALLLAFVSGTSLQGYVAMHLFYRTFFGPPARYPAIDAITRERIALVGLAALLVAVGLTPQVTIDGRLPGSSVAADSHVDAAP